MKFPHWVGLGSVLPAFRIGAMLKRAATFAFVLLLVLNTGMAASNPDDDYVQICLLMQSADTLDQGGNAAKAHEKYIEAWQKLSALQRANPTWNPSVVKYRLRDLGEKIAATEKPVAAAAAITPDTNGGETATAVSKSPVKLLETGAEPRTAIRIHPAAGTKQTLVLTMKVGMDMSASGQGAPAMDIPAILTTLLVEVKSVASNGDISYQLTYEDVTVDASGPNTMPAVADAMKKALGGMRGMTGTGRMTDRGLIQSLQMKSPPGADPQISQIMGQMKDSFSSSSTPFPDEAVGAGAKWEYKTKLKQQGMTIDQTITSELASVEADRVTVRNTITQSAANQKISNPNMPGLKLDLTKMSGSGSGSSTFNLSQLLPVSATLGEKLAMSMAMNMGQQKQTMDMKMTVDVTIESK